ncbi:hypothetical protein BSLG_001695 [Batrachochytrium salamandrivorans]|nr:hypothetical protein BSLG_001695 [Batrachochytrium salamandrivorans]
MAEMTQKILVVGAGCSGLAALKECLAEGIDDIVCFEMLDSLGGLWRYEEVQPNKQVHSSVYRNTVIDTSKEMMAYSDFPIPSHWPTYLHNKAIVKYFDMYAQQFDLMRHIQFNTTVMGMYPLGSAMNDSQDAGLLHTGKWEVQYSQDGKTLTRVFDKIIVASGHHWKPKMPHFDGMDEFTGTMMHSHYYRRCLVVGLGNSAVDVAVELSYHSKQVHVSSRSSAWLISRYGLNGKPTDQTLSRFYTMLPMLIRNALLRFVVWVQLGNLARFGLWPKHSPFSAHPTINGELPGRIGTGAVVMKNNVKRFFKLESDKTTQMVEFEDGTSVPIDTVVFCTGYEIGYPFLDAKSIVGLHDPGSNVVELYKFVWPVYHDNIAFIGLFQPLGAIIPGSELQSRWVARLWTGKCRGLPGRVQRLEDIQKKQHRMKQRYVASPRHTIQVDAGPYFDEIAEQFGAAPNLWKLFFTDHYLWRQLMFGCWNAHHYRLTGPGAWAGARQAILAANSDPDFSQWDGLPN